MVNSNSKILITGASDGIGRSFALQLAKLGCSLILLGRNEEKLLKVRTEINRGNIYTYAFDLTDAAAFEKNIEQIIKDHADISVLINNAGVWQKQQDLDSIPDEVIEQIIHTNLTAPVLLTRKLLPGLRKQPQAAIINVVSRSGVVAQKGRTVYSATKWGMRGFTDVLKEDLKDSKVRVAGIYQSGVNTNMFAKTGDEVALDKYTHPDDLADIIVFMLTRPEKTWLNEVRINY